MYPTGGEPYKFETYKEAFNMVGICYGTESLNKDVKIEKIDEEVCEDLS